MSIPYSEEAEKAYVGMLLQGWDDFERLPPSAFYSKDNALIYEAFLRVVEKGGKPDFVSISTELKGEVGHAHVDSCISAAGWDNMNMAAFRKEIMATKARRDAMKVGEMIARRAEKGEEDVSSILSDAMSKMEEVGKTETGNDSVATFDTLYEELCEYVASNEKRKPGEPLGYKTGIKLIDTHCEGIQAGTVTRLNAYSNVGKTRLAISILASLLKDDVSVAFFSTEVVKKYFSAMLVSAFFGAKYDDVKRGAYPDLSPLAKKNVKFWDDKFDLKEIEFLVRKHKPQVVFIDFCQNINAGFPGDEYKNMSAYAREIQKLAITTGVAVFDLSQVSNEGAKEGRSSSIINSKGSGALVASADVALMMYREWLDEEHKKFTLMLEVKKNKYGPYGSCELIPDFQRLRFEEFVNV